MTIVGDSRLAKGRRKPHLPLGSTRLRPTRAERGRRWCAGREAGGGGGGGGTGAPRHRARRDGGKVDDAVRLLCPRPLERSDSAEVRDPNLDGLISEFEITSRGRGDEPYRASIAEAKGPFGSHY